MLIASGQLTTGSPQSPILDISQFNRAGFMLVASGNWVFGSLNIIDPSLSSEVRVAMTAPVFGGVQLSSDSSIYFKCVTSSISIKFSVAGPDPVVNWFIYH